MDEQNTNDLKYETVRCITRRYGAKLTEDKVGRNFCDQNLCLVSPKNINWTKCSTFVFKESYH